jgi:hypothetical protein
VTAVAFAGSALPDAAAHGSAAELPPLLVSAAADRSLRLWNVATMQRQRALYKRPAEVSAVAVSRWVLSMRACCWKASWLPLEERSNLAAVLQPVVPHFERTCVESLTLPCLLPPLPLPATVQLRCLATKPAPSGPGTLLMQPPSRAACQAASRALLF